MDIRVESLIESIHNYRDQCKDELGKIKFELIRLKISNILSRVEEFLAVWIAIF